MAPTNGLNANLCSLQRRSGEEGHSQGMQNTTGILEHRTVNMHQISEHITRFMKTLKMGPDQAYLAVED